MDNIAELSGWSPKEIAENLGMSADWVRKYISNKYKNQEMQEIARQRHANRESQYAVISDPQKSADEEPSMFASFTEFINFLLLHVF